MNQKKLNIFSNLIVIAIILLGIFLRSYKIDAPLADWHSWRQADTAAVSRNFVKDGFNLLYPQSDSFLALNDKGLQNPDRYFINEFPLYNATVAILYKIFGVNVELGRMVSIFMSMLGALALYGLVKKLLGGGPAIAALLYYTVLPYNVFYGRVFMPDPSFVSLSIISLYFCVKWVETEKNSFGMATMIAFALAMLVKPYAVFMAIPMFYWVIFNWGLTVFKKPMAYVVALGSFIPILLWRYHYYLHPEGSFASTWLLNGGDIRFTGAFFRWIIFDRFNRLIFATGGFVLFVVGLMTSYLRKNTSLFFVWGLAILLYITIFAKGNVNHDYYQLPIVAPGIVLAIIGGQSLINLGKSTLQKIINFCFVIILVVISLAFGWYEVRGFFNINNPAIVEAGQKLDEIAPAGALVIAPYGGDPAFLYQTNRHGWPVGGDAQKRMDDGATYYVTTSKEDEFARLKSKYGVVFENDNFAIIHLVQ
ncbi:MAG: glycosyltransferase family 39 protein [Microgenomates group bacterium]